MNKTTIDIQAFINEHPFTKYQWMILALCFITVAMDGFDTAIIGFIASDLVQEWGVEKSALGPVMSAALVGLAVGALTAGRWPTALAEKSADHVDRGFRRL
jgi:AAHS family 4-hydroxybenzoate transporter-like MFS transporter